MLSQEHRSNFDAYSMVSGMRNVVFATGIVSELDARGGKLLQTRYANLAIPFRLADHDSMPARVRRGNPVKIIGRVEGGRHPQTGEPTSVLRVLRFESPRVMDLPPEAAWEVSVRKGVAQADVTPTTGQTGLANNRNANMAWVAGFVAAARLRKAGAATQNGPAGSDCLYLLLQQTEDPTKAIPVRLYGRVSGLHERAIRVGSPIQVRDGALRVDAKPTGEVLENGLEVVNTYTYVKATALHTATKDDIVEIPEWARRLASEANEARQRKAEDRREPVKGGQGGRAADDEEGDDGGSINLQRVATELHQAAA
jgi:hypothetical protein